VLVCLALASWYEGRLLSEKVAWGCAGFRCMASLFFDGSSELGIRARPEGEPPMTRQVGDSAKINYPGSGSGKIHARMIAGLPWLLWVLCVVLAGPTLLLDLIAPPRHH
jgi:hypothetical protein